MTADYVGFWTAVRTDTSDPYEPATPVTIDAATRGLAVAVVCAFNTQHVNTLTIGGVALSRVTGGRADDTAGESGAAEWWFLGSGLPAAGDRLLVADLTTATTNDIQFTVVQLSGDDDLEIEDTGLLTADQADPQVTLAYGGKTCIGLVAIHSGAGAPADLTLITGMTAVADNDFGSYSGRVDRQTTPGATDFTIGYTALTDDVALAAIAVTEVAGGGEAHSGSVTATGGGVSVVSSSKDGLTAITGTGAGIATLAQATERAVSVVATGGGSGTVGGEGAHSAGVAGTGGGTASLSVTSARLAAALMSGGGVMTSLQTTERFASIVGTGGGIATISGTGGEAHTGEVTATGGGVATLAFATARFAEVDATGGGVAVATGIGERAAALTATGGGVATLTWTGAHAGIVIGTGGGVATVSGGPAAVSFGRGTTATVVVPSRPSATVAVPDRPYAEVA